MGDFKTMRLERADGLARLTFTQAERGNPIDGLFCAEICEVATELSEDRGVRAVLVQAEGKAFSYGGDIGAFTADFDSLPRDIKRWTTNLHSAIARLQRMDAPIVSAVHGVCAGGMAAFVAGTDIVLVSDKARFVAAYAGIGYSCDAGSSVMFTRRMGLGRARRYFLLNETLSAEQALAAGLADEVLPADALVARAEAVAKQLASGPTRAFGEIRRLMLSAEDQPLETQLELEAQALARMTATADAREALTAFVEGRPAKFEGR